MSARRPLLVALAVTVVVTTVSYVAPEGIAAEAVALTFFAATYYVTLHGQNDATVRRYGLALGGLLERTQLQAARMLRETGLALAWALGAALLVFPPFVFGWLYWWAPKAPFVAAAPPAIYPEVIGQLVVIALPEEAFFRGYLLTELDSAWKSERRLFGLSWGTLAALVVSSAIFALGHLLTQPNPARLAVFFPALLFGWLRLRTKGIGAAVIFHAMCNLFADYLARSYGLWGS